MIMTMTMMRMDCWIDVRHKEVFVTSDAIGIVRALTETMLDMFPFICVSIPVDGWIGGWITGWVYAWMDGWLNRWMDG